MSTRNIIIVGAGGFGREILSIIRDISGFQPVGFLDSDQNLHGVTIDGCSILGDDGILEIVRAERQADSVFIAVSDARIRKHLFKTCVQLEFRIPNLIHPQAYLSSVSTIGIGNVFYPGCIIMVGCQIGNGNLINAGATVGHETTIGDFCTINPGAHVAGRAQIKEGAFVGIGGSIKEKLVISEYAVIGAGSAVVKDVPAYTTVYGVPAHRSEKQSPK